MKATSIERASSPTARTRTIRQHVIDLPVGRKLLGGFAALTFVLGLVIACLFLTVARLEWANGQIVEVTSTQTRAADRLRLAAEELRAAQQAYVLDWPSPAHHFDQAAAAFESALEGLSADSTDPVAETLVHKITTGYQTFRSTDQLIREALQSGDPTLARNLTLGPERLAFELLAADASHYAELAESTQRSAVRHFDDATSDAHLLGGALGVMALLVMAFANWIITRLIRDPLHRVQQAAERAAEGDLAAEADVHGDDETGRLALAFNTMLTKLRQREEALLADHRRQATGAKVQRALDMADEEPAALDVVGLTFEEILPGRSVELLLANNSKSHLDQAVVAGSDPAGPGCPVTSPFSCVAVRSGSAITFDSSTALDACPHLRNRGVAPCSAVCVPVTFMGRAMGVIHSVGPVDHQATATEIDALTMLSTQAGARIGMLRTMVRTQEQASTDSLTGLMNRRTFQARIRSLRRGRTPFAFVMADIDHFKRINDTHGHETGDRAIKTFCEVATASLRQTDLMARWGGEEFAFAFTDLTPEQARDAIDRIRLELAARLSTSDLPGFTVSYGIVDADRCATLEDALRLADDALYEAKAVGRNCSVIGTPDAGSAEPEPTVAPRFVKVGRPGQGGVLAHLVDDDDPLDH